MTHAMRTKSGEIVYVLSLREAPAGSVCEGVEREDDGIVTGKVTTPAQLELIQEKRK